MKRYVSTVTLYVTLYTTTSMVRFLVNKSFKVANKNTRFLINNWIFYVKLYTSNTKMEHAIQLRFRILQHDKNLKLIEVIMKYYGSSYIEKHTIFSVVTLVIVRFSIIIEKVISFFFLRNIFI